CGHTMPEAPRSSACLAWNCAFSAPFGGMRTIGVTAGATEPDFAIWPRLSMYCRLSRSARMSHGLCSISYTMPSYLAVAIAIAVSGSAWQNEVNEGLPDSRALITLLRRGSSTMLFPLGAFAPQL